MQHKIVFLDAASMGDTDLGGIRQFGELAVYLTSTLEESLERVKDCDILITNKVQIDKELIDAAPELKLVCEAATGTNNIDIAYCNEKGIGVRNVAAYSTDSVVQSTFMHLLSLMGNAPYFDAKVKSGEYSASGLFTDVSRPFIELAGKTMGIIGMGAIGTKTASVAQAFGMKVIYFSTSGTSHCTTYPSVSLENLLAQSDVVSIHAPLNARTKGLIGRKELAMMKPSAVILNLGRGGIIDETALADAIENDIIAGAALDVFETEPLPSDSPLIHISKQHKLRFTPHTGWASVEARKRLIEGVIRNIKEAIS